MSIRFSIKETVGQLAKKINRAFQELKRVLFKRANPVITRKVRAIIRAEMENDPAIQSLLDDQYGSLKSQFGLTDAIAINAVLKIIDFIAESVEVKIVGGGTNQGDSLIVSLAPLDISPLLSIDEAVYYSNRVKSVKWLEWLLTKGTQIVIDGWSIVQVDNDIRSRTGSALMKQGGWFRVEGGFDGIIDDNFITRAVLKNKDMIIDEIYKTIRNTNL